MTNTKKNTILFWVTLVVMVAGGFFVAFTAMSIMFSYNVLDKESMAPWLRILFYVLVSIIFGLIRLVIYLFKNANFDAKKSDEQSEKDKEKKTENDLSIKVMIERAYEEKRYSEVMNIGAALSDLLWYSGQRKMRIWMGGYVEKAASQTKNKYHHARVLIEDIGNTYIEMPGRDSLKKAVKNIRQGILLAEESPKEYYLIARGYRNLACALLYKYHIAPNGDKRDLDEAEDCIRKGNEAQANIPEYYSSADAKASLSYAQFRVHQLKGETEEARECLEVALVYYQTFAQSAKNASLARERLKKIKRELGAMLLVSDAEEDVNQGETYILEALECSEEDRDHCNLVRCAEIYIQHKRGNDDETIAPVISACNRMLKDVPENDTYKKRFSDLVEGLRRDGVL